MRILMLGWELPPHNSGGLGVACYHLAKALAQSGVTIDFVLPYQAEHPKTDFMRIHAATQLTAEDYRTFGAYTTSTETIITTEDDELTDMRAIQRRYAAYVEELIKTEHFDAVHAHDWLTMEAGVQIQKAHKLPLVVHVHATEFDRSGLGGGNPLIHEIEYHGLMAADRIIAVSNGTKNMIISRYQIPADKIEVAHNAIDPTSFNQDGYLYDQATYAYLESLKQEGYTIVTTITRFTVQKGLTFLMRAAAQATENFDRLAFLFVGDGELRDELVQQAADFGIADKVFFTGFVRGQKWRDAYSVSDIFVMSSVSEPFGLTALEAAHHETALILTNQSGVSEVLDNIFTYDFWDVAALADRIIGIATSPALEQSLKDNVKQEYCRLSWSDVATSCQRIYSEVQQGVAV